MASLKYDCSECPAFCCSIYERVPVSDDDLARMSSSIGITIDEATRRFTKIFHGERVLRRRSDKLLGRACKFLSAETRRCTIYEARPQACRDYPQANRCAYYDLLKFERKLQGTNDVTAIIQLSVRYPEE